MTPEEYIRSNALCLEECESSDSSEFVDKKIAISAVRTAKIQMADLACKLFKQQCPCTHGTRQNIDCDKCWRYLDFNKIINM